MITWLHTFSPAKMWIAGLMMLEKPMMQFHTQFNAEIPWDTMDMDFMNLNQTAHGGREFGFMGPGCASPALSPLVTGRIKKPGRRSTCGCGSAWESMKAAI